MSTRTELEVPQPDERPDPQYTFVAGLYIAALLTPIAILALSTTTGNAGLLYVGFLGTITLLTAAASWRLSQVPELAVRLGQFNTLWLLIAIPFVPFVGVFAAPVTGIHLPTIAVPLAMLMMIMGLVLGLPLVVMSRNRYTAAVLTDADEYAAWEARWPQRWRRVAVGGMVLAMAGGAAGVIVQFWFGIDWAGSLYWLLIFWTPLAGAASPRTFRVSDAGLVIEQPLQRRLRPWSAFNGYKLTEEALLIQPRAWWRPTLRCDRTDIEDIDAVVASLDTVFAK